MKRLKQGLLLVFPVRPLSVLFAVIVTVTGGLTELLAAEAIETKPKALTFQGVLGGANPPSQILEMIKSNAKQISWSGADNASWLSVSPQAGKMGTSTRITVSVNITGLPAGNYKGNVMLTLSRGGSISIPISLTVASISSDGTSTTGTTPTTVTWIANAESDLAGYKVYVGTSSGLYGAPIDVGKVTSYTLANLKVGATYYFSVTAYDVNGNESIHSAEVSKSIY